MMVTRGSSIGRCNSIQCLDSAMLRRENHLFGCARPKPSQGSVPAGLALAKGCCKTPIFQNSIARTNNFVEKWCRDGCFELQALTGYSPRPHGLRWPMDLLAGWTHIDRSQRIVEDKRLERCGVSLIEFHASENRCGGGARRGFSTSIQPLSRAGNEQRVVQTGLLTEAEQQKQQCPADED